MRIAYVAPRYHTNQVPIIKGFVEEKDEVLFISQYQGKSEDYSYGQPYILGYSPFFMMLYKGYYLINKKKLKHSSFVEAFQMRYGIPPINTLKKLLKEMQPEIVILRERSIYNIIVHLICKKYKIKTVLYNQNPLYDSEPEKMDLPHKIVRALTPKKRMTPVLGDIQNGYLDQNAYYIPFVMDDRNEKAFSFLYDRINIICIAKYEERKNILMLLEVVKELEEHTKIHLTIVGEVTTDHHRAYKKKVDEFVEKNDMQEIVTRKENLTRNEVFKEYEKADLFVLPSTKEFASISQLEAMSCGLPVVCSNKNGSACYIEQGINGFLFQDNNKTSLKQAIEEIIGNKETLLAMGKMSRKLIKVKYGFSNYKEAIKKYFLGRRALFVVATMQGGGTERVIAVLSNYFIEKGIRVAILMTAGEEVAYELHPDIELLSIGESTKGSIKKRVERIKTMRRIFEEYNGETILSFGTETNLFSILAHMGLKSKIIISERNDPNRCDYPLLRNIVYSFGNTFVFQTKDAMECFSKSIQKRSIIIANPINEQLPMPIDGIREPIVAAVGRLESQKNYPLLLRAFAIFQKEYQEYQLHIYGKGELKEELMYLVKQLGIETKVIFKGFVPNAMECILTCKMYVLSSDYEGISNSLMEAMAIGLPVISTDCPIGGSRMCIEQERNGILVPLNDENALAYAMKKIASKEEYSIKMGQEAAKLREKFSTKKIGTSWLELLGEEKL